MGAGNPLLKSFDEALYSPKTYYIYFGDLYKDRDQAVKENYEANELEGFDDLTEDELNKEFYNLLEFDVEDFQDNFFFNLPDEYNWFEEPHDSERFMSELLSSFRGSAYVLAQTDDCLVITAEAEVFHYPIALVPRFTLCDIQDDYWNENSHKQDWYEARDKNFDAMVEDKAIEIYEKKLKKWKKKYEPFMRWFHSIYKEALSVRCGAWTSTSIKTIGKDYKFL